MQTKRQINGFTLIELMIAMVVIGIGLAITIPAMMNFTNTNRKAEQINKLVRDITSAKNSSVNRGESFCINSTSGTATWDGGWFVDDAATNTVIRRSTTIAVTGETIASSSGATALCFNPSGSLANTNATATIEQCSACVNTLNREKQIAVAVTGRISLNSQYACVPAAPLCP